MEEIFICGWISRVVNKAKAGIYPSNPSMTFCYCSWSFISPALLLYLRVIRSNDIMWMAQEAGSIPWIAFIFFSSPSIIENEFSFSGSETRLALLMHSGFLSYRYSSFDNNANDVKHRAMCDKRYQLSNSRQRLKTNAQSLCDCLVTMKSKLFLFLMGPYKRQIMAMLPGDLLCNCIGFTYHWHCSISDNDLRRNVSLVRSL